MNPRQLELFYHVALHRGISRASRAMPRRIQQPALSEQMQLLEESVGTPLFVRQPFRLTEAGHALWVLLDPFFTELEQLVARLAHHQSHLRIAAPETVLENELPPVLGCLVRLRPGLHFTLRSGSEREMRGWLQDGAVDLAISAQSGRVPAGISSRPLLSLPLVLLVHRASPIRDAAHFWRGGTPAEPLVCPDPAHGVGATFQRGLRRGGVSWPIALTTNSAADVTRIVAEGLGVGVSLKFHRLVRHPQVRVLPLAGFDPVTISMLWPTQEAHRLGPLIEPFETQARALADTLKRPTAPRRAP